MGGTLWNTIIDILTSQHVQKLLQVFALWSHLWSPGLLVKVQEFIAAGFNQSNFHFWIVDLVFKDLHH